MRQFIERALAYENISREVIHVSNCAISTAFALENSHVHIAPEWQYMEVGKHEEAKFARARRNVNNKKAFPSFNLTNFYFISLTMNKFRSFSCSTLELSVGFSVKFSKYSRADPNQISKAHSIYHCYQLELGSRIP